MASIVENSKLEASEIGHEFQGFEHGSQLSYILVEAKPGEGVALHLHPYEEIFIVLEGTARYTVGEEIVEAHGGQTLIGPANVPHKFVNIGSGILRQVDI